MTTENETGRAEPAARRVLDGETRPAYAGHEVTRHSLGRTGKTARAIEAGLVALRDDTVLAPGQREAIRGVRRGWSRSTTPSADGGGIGSGIRCVRWRDAVLALLGALRADPAAHSRSCSRTSRRR